MSSSAPAWGIHLHGCARPGTRLDKQQARRAKRRLDPAVKAVMSTFKCDAKRANAIIDAARRANKESV